ncbi:MAG: AmmeMemoRadiSam system protein A [Acidobacteria bacterium]|nr:AmmeMemoRadiSam system protein A [Acidobacteriota bacterium]
MLDDSNKAKLLNLARKTLEDHFIRGSIPDFQTDCTELLERKGAFVTLHMGGELRGCIGQLDPDRELFKVVQHCALSAALSDPRFPPLQQKELDGLDIEISILTPFQRVESIEEINVGSHGLYIVQGYFRGLLLPQVATQYRWDRITFLDQACFKAGLKESAWKDPKTIIYIFEAEVFSDPKGSA